MYKINENAYKNIFLTLILNVSHILMFGQRVVQASANDDGEVEVGVCVNGSITKIIHNFLKYFYLTRCASKITFENKKM